MFFIQLLYHKPVIITFPPLALKLEGCGMPHTPFSSQRGSGFSFLSENNKCQFAAKKHKLERDFNLDYREGMS
jgi:hypothetical protein